MRRYHPESNREDWVQSVLSDPIVMQRQPDGRIRRWGFVEEAGKYLRVVTEADAETVHTAFFDRNFTREMERSGR